MKLFLMITDAYVHICDLFAYVIRIPVWITNLKLFLICFLFIELKLETLVNISI